MKWSIRLKFLLVMCGLLTVCLGAYLLMAVTVFKSDKVQLVYDLNRSQVSNLASEIETLLGGVAEKLKLFAQLPPSMQSRLAQDLFSEDSDIVAVRLYKFGNDNPVATHTDPGFLETYGLTSDDFQALTAREPAPLARVQADGQAIWNASQPGAPPMMGLGRLVVMQDTSGRPLEQWAVVAYLKLDRFLKSVNLVSLSRLAVVNRHGDVLVQPEAQALAEKPSVHADALFQAAVRSRGRVTVSTAEENGAGFMTAQARAFNGEIYVLAKAPEAEVFRVVRELGVRTLLFGSIVLTLVILAAFLLSRSLTRNIALLSERMEAASAGDLSTTIELAGRDETVQLAITFNQMMRDLKISRDDLEMMNRELDHKVKERTHQLEIQNQKVKEAQEALLRTTRMASVGEIAGRTAHEVLNPLTSLLTRAGLMQKRVRDDYQQRLKLLEDIGAAWRADVQEGGFERLVANWKNPSTVQKGKNLFEEDLENLRLIASELASQGEDISGDMQFIREEGARIGKIIHSMRRLGHAQGEARDQSLHAILEDCRHIMADLFDQYGVRLDSRFEATGDLIKADRDELIQAITNLMRNSLQAIVEKRPPSSSRLILRTGTDARGVWIEIEDNGPGIAPEHRAKLFETAFTTKSPDEGTGLGLGISRRFVRAQGGDIEFVSSVPFEKTIFRIHLPLARQPGAAA